MKNKEKYKAGEYGFLTLAELVDDYMIHSFNNGQRYYKNMLKIAENAWNQLYWKILRVTKSRRLMVDQKTMTVEYPADCRRMLAVKVIECDRLKPLNYDPYRAIRTLDTTCNCKKCSCSGELCTYMNGISYVSEDVLLNDTIYQRVTKTKVLPNGDLIQEIKEPFVRKDTDTGTLSIVFRTHVNHVGSLEIKPCGCVADTEPNRRLCFDYGGCPVVSCSNSQCDEVERRFSCDSAGDFKLDSDAGLIYLFDTSAKKVEVMYISNGQECAEEIVIPEYCNEAMFAALFFGSIRFRSNVSPYEKRQAKSDLAFENQELYEFLNPLVAHEFLELQHSFHKW